MRSLLMIVAGMCATVVFALDYPVYTVTTSGDGTSDLTSAQVEVVSTEGANPEMVGFSSLSLTTGTFRKRGTGYLMSADAMSGFKGTILVEEGAFIAQKNGHLGPAQSGTAAIDTATVVVSNGASLVLSGDGGGNGAFRIGNTIHFRGTGYQNIGAINLALTSSSQNFLFMKGNLVMDDNATIGFSTKSTGYIYYCNFAMNGHTLTAKAVNSSSRASTLGFEGNNIQTPGNIVIDSVYFRPWGDGNEFNGSSANFLTITGGGSGELFPSQHVKPRCFWTLDLTDSVWVERTHNDSYAANAYATTNQYGWAGPVRLTGTPRLHWSADASGKDSFTFLGRVYGTGGFATTRASRINLVDGSNSFEGLVNINTYHHGIAELRVFQDGALPPTCAGAFLDHCNLTLMYSHTYHLPALTFDIYTGKTATFTGGTNGVIRSLKKMDSGVLDMTAPLTVTGVTELAGGTLRLPCDRAGMTLGWRVQEGDSNAGINDLSQIFANRVELGANLAYRDDKVEWQRNDTNVKRLFTYRGYIWNRTNSAQNWTFAAQIVQGMLIFIDGVQCSWSNLKYWEFYANQNVGFVTVNNVTPGCHQIDVRIYTTSGGSGYGTVANRRGGASSLTNATWQADLGLAIDRQGRGSTNYADYERLVDPGDGSFLTVVPEGAESAEGVIAHMPKFDHLKFTGGTLDIRGSDITVPVLEGVNGAVTNSNVYYPNGSLTVGEKWIFSGSDMANKTLNVTGKLKFADGAMLDCADLALLSRKTEHTLATATGGIEGMPVFDGNAPGNKGWHLVKVTENDLESLKFFWRLGTTVVIR